MRTITSGSRLTLRLAVLILAMTLAPGALAATWRSTDGGNWSNITITGWNGPYPNSNTSTGVFNLDLTSDATVVVDVSDAMARQITFTDATNPSHNWIITSSDPVNNKLIIARDGTSSIISNAGSHVIAAPVVLGGTGSPQVTVLGTRLTISGDITEIDGAHTMALATGSTGILELSGNNSYSNFTNIAAGTLLMNGTHTESHNWLVASGASLGGTSSGISLAAGRSITFNTAAGVRSNFRPGDGGVGKFMVSTTDGTGGVNLAGADYHWEVGSLVDAGPGGAAGAGTAFDQLAVHGGDGSTTILTLGGISQLTIGFSGVGNPDAGSTFWDADHLWKVIDVSGTATTSGAFTGLVNAGWDSGTFTSFVGNGTDGDTGDVYIRYTSVPEPAAAGVLMIALAALVRRRRAAH